MVLRDELNLFLARLYAFESFEDFCENGLQVEGKEQIEKIVLGVSFNLHLLNKAVEAKADAVIVHHGIFDRGFFVLKGRRKKIVKLLLDHDISLFGIHLPMDAHPELGHSAQLLSYIKAGSVEPFELGFIGQNVKGYTLDRLLDIFHETLHPRDVKDKLLEAPHFSLSEEMGFTVLRNGPDIPQKIVVITGGSSAYYEKAIELGVDTFICGEIKEKIPALSFETNTNFINLGHYYSEKPGMLALQKRLREEFTLETEFIEIPNPI